MKVIEIRMGDATGRFALLERRAPKTVAALWDSLPIAERFTHARWAGAACWLKVDRSPLAAITELESPVSSIYKGTLVLRPSGGGRVELYLSYGQAESRHERGRTYVTPVAEVSGDATALYAAMAATWKGGSADVSIARA